MAGNITNQRSVTSVSVPGVSDTFAQLIEDFPELADEIMALTAFRDVGQPDQHDNSFNARYPSMKPQWW